MCGNEDKCEGLEKCILGECKGNQLKKFQKLDSCYILKYYRVLQRKIDYNNFIL